MNDDTSLSEQSVVGPLVAYDAVNWFKMGLMAGKEKCRKTTYVNAIIVLCT